ncbi:helix-turn-helix transcriptional regulator [Bacillus spongiae]|uniref:Helix-turn-helix transcriptional regulator n=1 Tax=Bacillus spongiae TaxID=2683610 RepID=A0ABU8HIU6_9BACI
MVGKKIREMRKIKGFSINELAQKSQVSKSYISSIERGIQRNPSFNVLNRISEALDLPLGDFIVMEQQTSIQEEKVDQTWLSLLNDAVENGLTKEEFIKFTDLMYSQKHDRIKKDSAIRHFPVK